MEDLRKSLKDRGSDLVIRFGNAENVIQQLATEVVTSLVTYLAFACLIYNAFMSLLLLSKFIDQDGTGQSHLCICGTRGGV